jgi:hypothetical protein
MTTAESAARRTGMRERIAWACWAGWAFVVVARTYARLWESLRHPSDVAAIVPQAIRESLVCTITGGAAILLAAAVLLAWRAVRARTGERAAAVALLAAAALALLWFRGDGAFVAWLSALQAPHLPAMGEAAARAGRGVCGAAFVALAAWTAGDLVMRPIGLAQVTAEERHLLALTLGAGVLSYSSSAAAWAGIYRPSTVALFIALVLAAGALARTRGGPRHAAERGAWPRSLAWAKPPTAMDAVWLGLAWLALSFALVAALAPETEYDALWYHLDLPRLWLDAGRPVDLIQEYPSLYPMTWELVYGAALVMGGAVGAKLLHLACLLVLAATLVIACRRYAPACSPYAVLGLLLTAPTMLWEGATAYNDLAIAMFAAVACYALARYAETGRSPWLIASALEFGLAVSTKHLGLVVLAVAAGLLLRASHRGRVPWRRTVHAIVVISLVALTLALPWYVRAWRGSGNPFFPELYDVFGGGPAARWDAGAERGLAAFKASFGRGHSAAALLRLPWDMTVHAALFGGSFGPLWLVLVPACLIGTRRRFAVVLALGASAYIAVWASPVSSLQLRFLVPVGGALALLAAEGWERVIGQADAVGVRWRRAAGSALLAVACVSLPPFTVLQETDRQGYQGWLTHVLRSTPTGVVIGRQTEAEYLAAALPSWAVWQYANTHLPPDAAVLTFSDGDNFYSRRTRFPADSVLARPAVWTAASADGAVAALRDLGVEFVIFDRRLLPRLQAYHLPIAGNAIQKACMTLYEDRHYRLCRLTAVSAAMPPRPAGAPASLP